MSCLVGFRYSSDTIETTFQLISSRNPCICELVSLSPMTQSQYQEHIDLGTFHSNSS